MLKSGWGPLHIHHLYIQLFPPVQKVSRAHIKWMARQYQHHGEHHTARRHADCVVLQRFRCEHVFRSCSDKMSPSERGQQAPRPFRGQDGIRLAPPVLHSSSFLSERQEIDSSSQVRGGCQFFSFKMQPGSCRSTSDMPAKTSLEDVLAKIKFKAFFPFQMVPHHLVAPQVRVSSFHSISEPRAPCSS